MRGIFLEVGLLLAVATDGAGLVEISSALLAVRGLQDLRGGRLLGEGGQHCGKQQVVEVTFAQKK